MASSQMVFGVYQKRTWLLPDYVQSQVHSIEQGGNTIANSHFVRVLWSRCAADLIQLALGPES